MIDKDKLDALMLAWDCTKNSPYVSVRSQEVFKRSALYEFINATIADQREAGRREGMRSREWEIDSLIAERFDLGTQLATVKASNAQYRQRALAAEAKLAAIVQAITPTLNTSTKDSYD